MSNNQDTLLEALENEQLAAVTDTFSENSVVAAGAGSGKTYTLARRFAWLICEKDIPVDRILTLTFTKKAAAEMYQRIYRTLVTFSQTLTGERQKRAETAVRDFSKAHIQTLDSYCSSVIKPVVHEYGIQPDFSTDVDAAEDAIRKEALPFVLENLDMPGLRMLISTSKPQDIADSLFATVMIQHSTLSKPVPFLNDFRRQVSKVSDELNKSIPVLEETLTSIHEDLLHYSGSMQEQKKQLLDILNDSNAVIPAISFTLSDEAAKEKQNQKIIACLNNLVTIATSHLKLSPHIKELRELFGSFSSLMNFICRYSELEDLYTLLDLFQIRCNTLKRKQGLLTFADAADLAISVLTDNKEIRRAEKAAYDKIMIDEFQDNNELQRNLLYLLSEKPELCSEGIPEKEDLVDGKLFFVGDEKQSIYKFRGADVSVFNNLKNSLKKNLSMSLNFRSHPALIAAFNTMFGAYPYPQQITEPYEPGKPDPELPALFKKTDIRDYEAGFNPALIPSKTFEKYGHIVSATPRIHAGIILKEKKTGADSDVANTAEEMKDTDSEAIWVTQKIKKLIESGRNPGDITILLKTLTHQRQFERYLRQAGIPYASESVSGFFDDSPVNDISACLRWCVYPSDRISYASLLKSPFIRLSDNAVRSVLSGQPISVSEQARLDSAMETLSAFRNELEHLSIAQAVTKLWYTFGYQYETRWNSTVGLYSELYDYLFELACRADTDNKTISWFVDYLQTLADDNGKLNDMDIPLERKNAVHIMTIHKSKGLEYPIVFLCNTAFKPNNRSATATVFYSKDWGVTINTGKLHSVQIDSGTIKQKNNFFYELSCNEEKLKERAELDRVLYVGITRACEELYITGCSADSSFALSDSNRKKMEEGSYIPGNIQDLMRPLYEYYTLHPEKSPFTLEMHAVYTRDEADALLAAHAERPQDFLSDAEGMRSNTADTRVRLAEEAGPLFNKAACPAPYVSTKKTWNPSHLGFSDTATAFSVKTAGTCPMTADNPPPQGIFEQVDALVKQVPAFTNAHFGTLAHAAIEEQFTETPIKLNAEIAAALSGEQREKILSLARQLAPSFIGSELGQLALHADWRQNEYDFKMRLPASESTGGIPVTVKGQIDLLFETEENGEPVITIVDFKTDSAERPEEHIMQLACYSHAARQMRSRSDGRQKKTRCWLYYLRSGHAVEITAETEKISLQDFAPLPDQKQTLQPE